MTIEVRLEISVQLCDSEKKMEAISCLVPDWFFDGVDVQYMQSLSKCRIILPKMR